MPANTAADLFPPAVFEDKPLRIALLGYRSNPFSGGQGIYIKYVARALHALGHHVDVISGEPYPELDAGINLIKLPGLNLYAQEVPLTALKAKHLTSFTDVFEWASMVSGGFPEPYTFGRRVHRFLLAHRHEYDIIHDNQSLSYGVLSLQRHGLPVTSTIHHPITFDLDIALANTQGVGMRLLVKRWHHFLRMQTKVARRLNHITTVSQCSKQDISAAFGVAPENIEVIYNGVDTDLFKPQANNQHQPYHVITTASADQPLKGTQHLIPAIAKVREDFPELTLTFIGKPKPGGDTEKLIARHNLDGVIEFQHGITPQQIVELYAKASVAVVPSEYEGFGLPAAEAMACAVPVVATDGGALPEVVGDAGITVAKANSDALAQGLTRLLQNPQLQTQYANAGRKRMLDLFSWENTAVALTQYYQRVMRINAP